MPKVATCLWYAHEGERAAAVYCSLLSDSRIDRVMRAPGDYPSGHAGDVLLVAFTLAG